MRVLHLLDYAPPFPGGIVAHLAAVGRRLTERGDALVLAFPRARAWFSEFRGVAEVVVVPEIWRPVRSGFAGRFDRLVQAERIDVAHISFSFALPFALAARLKRPSLPIVFHWHNPPLPLLDGRHRPPGLTRRPAGLFAGPLARFTDGRVITLHLTVSAEIRDLLLAHRWTTPDKVAALPNALPAGVPPTRQPRGGTEALRVGSVANFRPQKDHRTLIHAFRRVRDRVPSVELLLVGDGPTRPAMERLVAELRLTGAVRFLGHVYDPDPVYRTMDLFALASHYEGHGLVILEAMSHGLPVVATDLPAIRETLGPDLAQCLVPREDPDAMADALHALIGDPGLRQHLGDLARRRVAGRYQLGAWCDALIRTYDALARGGGFTSGPPAVT